MEDLARRAEELKRGLTPEQLEARARVERHQAILQGGVRRGPNAPKDGTFGGRPRSEKAAA